MGSGKDKARGKSRRKKDERKGASRPSRSELRQALAEAVDRAERAEARATKAARRAKKLAARAEDPVPHLDPQVAQPGPPPAEPRPEVGSPADLASRYALPPQGRGATPEGQAPIHDRAPTDFPIEAHRVGWFTVSQALLLLARAHLDGDVALIGLPLVGVTFCWTFAAGWRAGAVARPAGRLGLVHTYLPALACQTAWVLTFDLDQGAVTALIAATLAVFLLGFVRWVIPDGSALERR